MIIIIVGGRPGCGVGGHCIAIDPWFIASQVPTLSGLIQSARKVNLEKTLWSIKLINNKLNSFEKEFNKKPILGIFGLTFKQDIDDIRESPAIFITDKLLEEGHNILICEPNLKEDKNYEIIDVENVIEKSDILLFLVPHTTFKNLDLKNKTIIDLCGIT